jgi:hypothetical protein
VLVDIHAIQFIGIFIPAQWIEAIAAGDAFMKSLCRTPAFCRRLDAAVPTIPPIETGGRMDFIYVALGAAFWALLALMARGCEALQGRKP